MTGKYVAVDCLVAVRPRQGAVLILMAALAWFVCTGHTTQLDAVQLPENTGHLAATQQLLRAHIFIVWSDAEKNDLRKAAWYQQALPLFAQQIASKHSA